MNRHLYCAYHNRGNGSFYHRKEVIKALWPEEVFKWHEWSDRMLRGTCDYGLTTWIGAAGTGKTTNSAAQALAWWLEAPFESAVMTCSTTLKLLKLRIWSEVSRLFYALPKEVEFQNENGDTVDRVKLGYVGELVDSDLMVRWKQGDNKNAIFGLGVNEGSVAEAVANLVGIHTKRIWLILDELQAVRQAIEGAKDNMAKNPVFRCLGMGNTDENMKSLLRKAAEPKGGWDSVDTSTAEEWETDGGVVCATGLAQRFDGLESPAYDDPKKYPFLINKAQIDAHIRKAGGNVNDPGYLSQCRAIWPAIGLRSTVLDSTTITKFKCKEGIVWTDGFEQGAALDPAYTDGGGDRKILQFYKFSLVRDDEGTRWVIQLGDWVDVPIDSNSSETLHYQMVYFCRDACESKGITSDEFALDSTGEGGALKSIFDKEWGTVWGCEFGGGASETPMPMPNQPNRTAKDVFDRRVSELAINVRNFALQNGLRGLSDEAAEQACERLMFFKNKKQCVEKKSEMKLRIQQSPDHLDACEVAVAHAMERGMKLTDSGVGSRKMQSVMQQLANEGAAMVSERGLLVDPWAR